uniref:Uncharacterized protein n=1 Tax=Candidatus Desulfatibia profunda TaxID=2841695 RepID=A0A8J6TL22_9BACT|nr:hypothetical protein [Candidatus Desulfatibia profunda]
MKKYSQEWKEAKGKWIQKHDGCWKIHYIEHDTEYSTGEYFTAKSAREDLKNY